MPNPFNFLRRLLGTDSGDKQIVNSNSIQTEAEQLENKPLQISPPYIKRSNRISTSELHKQVDLAG